MTFSGVTHISALCRVSMRLVDLAIFQSMAIAVIVSALPSIALAQSESTEIEEIIALKEVMCKELIGQAGDDRDRSISFLHGFVLGGLGQSDVNIEDVIAIEDVFFETCLDNPKSAALAVMKSAYGVSNE